MALASKSSTLFGWFMKALSLALLLSPALFAAAPFVAFVGHTYDRLRGCLGMAQVRGVSGGCQCRRQPLPDHSATVQQSANLQNPRILPQLTQPC
jgi:hypothetical protein